MLRREWKLQPYSRQTWFHGDLLCVALSGVYRYGPELQVPNCPTDPPVFMGYWRGRSFWVYGAAVYSTTRTDLRPGDVRALANEEDNRAKARLARARAAEHAAHAPARPQRPLLPDEVKTFVWQRDAGKCVRCGSNQNLEFDHIIPVSMGGANTARNLQLLCEGCNRAKGGSLV